MNEHLKFKHSRKYLVNVNLFTLFETFNTNMCRKIYLKLMKLTSLYI